MILIYFYFYFVDFCPKSMSLVDEFA